MQHVLAAGQFDKEELSKIFKHAESMRTALSKMDTRLKLARTHQGKVLATLFYEPSTRTRLSFEAAAQRLGAGLISTENASEFSSAIKGETIEDTIRTVGCYADAIVLRHKETGAADRAAAVSTVPIINAGDGTGEHPTQALLDLYTIYREKGRLDNLHIVIGGDLKHGRTARSLTHLLSMYPGIRITFVSVPELQMSRDVTEHLEETGTKYTETDDLLGSLHDVDVVYWTRLQKERLADPSIESSFIIDQAALQAMPETAIIMHPLPRVKEIETSVDSDPRAKYFDQVQNGLYLRMSLLDNLLKSV